MDRWFGTSWATPRTVKLQESLFSWKDRRKRRRHRAWNVVPLELIWVVWRERNMSAFEGGKVEFFSVVTTIVSDPLFSFGAPIEFSIVMKIGWSS